MAKLKTTIINAAEKDPFDPGLKDRNSKQRTEVQDTVNQHHETGGHKEKENVPNELKDVTPGTKTDTGASHGRRADEPAPKPDLPQARPNLREDQANAEKRLKEARNERDESIESARQDRKQTKRNMREKSIVPDDFDFDDEFDSTDPFIASLFQKGKINKLLKDQIKEQYPDQLAEIAEKVKNDPENKDLSGKDMRKLINAEVKKFVEPLWKKAGGDTQVNKVGLITPVATAIKKMMEGAAHESVTKVLSDKRAALEKKQNRSLKDQMFLDAFDMIEKDQGTAETTAELKGEVKNARSRLTDLNAEAREHEKAVDRALNEFNKGGRKSRTERKDGWDFTHTSRDGKATQYASRVEDRDGKKMYVTYSVTAGSPDTQRDPVRIAEYQEYQGERDPNIQDVENFAEARLDQVEGGFKGKNAAIRNAQNEKDFASLDGQNYFTYREAHKLMAPKIMKLISGLGGKIDAETGKIYTTSVDKFPEGANELKLGYKDAKHVAGKSDEDVAKLTGMTPEEVKVRQITGMTRDKGVTVLPSENKASISGKQGRSFYINWNEPHNRKVVAEYAKKGIDKKDIPISELKTVNTSRSNEGSVDWSDAAKTKAAEKAQADRYTGAYKPRSDVLDALIGFGRR